MFGFSICLDKNSDRINTLCAEVDELREVILRLCKHELVKAVAPKPEDALYTCQICKNLMPKRMAIGKKEVYQETKTRVVN